MVAVSLFERTFCRTDVILIPEPFEISQLPYIARCLLSTHLWAGINLALWRVVNRNSIKLSFAYKPKRVHVSNEEKWIWNGYFRTRQFKIRKRMLKFLGYIKGKEGLNIMTLTGYIKNQLRQRKTRNNLISLRKWMIGLGMGWLIIKPISWTAFFLFLQLGSRCTRPEGHSG